MRVRREAPSRAQFLQWCPCIRLGTTEGTRARLVNIPVATAYWSGYRSHVAANSATGRRNPSKQKAHSAPFRLQALFFCVRIPVLWRLCVGRLRSGRDPFAPVFLPHA